MLLRYEPALIRLSSVKCQWCAISSPTRIAAHYMFCDNQIVADRMGNGSPPAPATKASYLENIIARICE
jgi:hypothetical protein